MTILYFGIDRCSCSTRPLLAILATLAVAAMLQTGPVSAAVETAVPTVAAVPATLVTPAVPATTTLPSSPAAPITSDTPVPSAAATLPAVPAAPVAPTVPAAPVAPDTPAAPSSSARVIQGTPASTAASTPTPGSAAGAAVASASGLAQISMVLLLVIGLIAGMAWLLRRLGLARNPTGTTVRVVSGVNLSNRERILVVEIADQWIVVGVAPGCINTLATMPRQETPTRDGRTLDLPAGKNFGVWLKRTIDQRNGSNGRNNNGN